MHEQEIIRATGIVDNDGMVTLFRNTDERQLENSTTEFNHIGRYKGNNLESWTTKPNLNWNTNGRNTKKVMAKIPLHACIASCIGRELYPFESKEECEIMVCGAFIKKVTYVGTDKVEIPDVLDKYLEGIKENMERFANENLSSSSSESKKSNVDPELERMFNESLNIRSGWIQGIP